MSTLKTFKPDFIDQYWRSEARLHEEKGRPCISYDVLNYKIKLMKERIGLDLTKYVKTSQKTVLEDEDLAKIGIEAMEAFFADVDEELVLIVNKLEESCTSIGDFTSNLFARAQELNNLYEFERLILQKFEQTHDLIDYANTNLVAARHLLKKGTHSLIDLNR